MVNDLVDSSSFLKHIMPVNQTSPQGGVLSGLNPVAFNSTDPIVLFVIQVIFQFDITTLVVCLLDVYLTAPPNPLLTAFLFATTFQASIIIITCRLLAIPLAKIRQPRVIAEGMLYCWPVR